MATLHKLILSFWVILSVSLTCYSQYGPIRGLFNQHLLVDGQDFNQGPPGGAFGYGPPTFQTSKLYRVHGMPMNFGR